MLHFNVLARSVVPMRRKQFMHAMSRRPLVQFDFLSLILLNLRHRDVQPI